MGKAVRAIIALLLPPLAVLDKGCGAIFLVTVLTFAGWVPGQILALILVLAEPDRARRSAAPPEAAPEAEKLKRAMMRLADGEVVEVIEDDGAPLLVEKHKREL